MSVSTTDPELPAIVVEEAIGREPVREQVREPASRPRKPRPLLLNRDYMLLWSGQTISSMGTQASGIAFPFLVLLITGSIAQAGFMGAVRAVPYVFFSLPAGALIDRWNRKLVMIVCDAGRAIALGSIPVALVLSHYGLGELTLVQLYVVSAVEGTLFVFFNLAEVACLPRVVPTEQLPAATAQNAVTDGTSALIGPPLGGALYGLSAMLPFVTDAVSYAASVLSLFFIRTRFQEERAGKRRHIWREIGEGLGWLFHQPLVRFIALLTGMSNLTGAGTILIIIELLKGVNTAAVTVGPLVAGPLSLGAFTVGPLTAGVATGLIFSIGGVGGIFGAVVATPIQKRLRFGVVIIGTSFLWVALWFAYLFAADIWTLGIITAASFVLGPIYNVTQFSYRLALIPDALQGRVNSVFRLLAFGGQPIGFALTGLALDQFGPYYTVAAIGAIQLVMAIATLLNGHVRRARPLAELQPAR
jgi:MFS family permease